jgi:RHS repeat-associated protein
MMVMARVRSSVKWMGGLVVLALILSGWVLRTESASSGGTASADVSAQIKVTFSGLRLNRTTQTYDTVATLTNTSTAPIQAPLELHVASITPATVTLQNRSGIASDGHPYVAAPLPTGTLAPGATVTNVVLRFNNPGKVQFTFTHHVFGTLAASNTPPVANAGPDQSARVGETVTLDASASTDADGDPLTYDWTLPGVPGSAATLADATTVNPQLTLNQPGAYTAQLVVHDGQAESAPDTVTVSTTNTAPVAHAGPNQTAPVNTTVQLDGSQSSDVDGNTLTFQWTLVSGPDGSLAELVNPKTVNPRLTLDRAGQYVVQLIVNDGTVDSAPASVTISTENSKPVADAGPAQTVSLNATVQLNGAGSSDADGDALTYQWTLISAPGVLPTLQNPTAVNPSFVADQAGAYVAQLIVNDGKTDSDPDTVTISTENSKPVANAGPDQTAEVGETVRLDGTGSHDADQDVLSYQWALTTRPPQSQALVQNAASAQTTFVPDLVGQYIAQLIVSDGVLSSLPDTATITVTPPTPTNRAPRILSSPVTTATVGQPYSYDVNATDDDGDALSYVLNAAPADMSINVDSGLIAWLPTTAGSVPVTVEVSDGQGGQATQSFSIQVQQEDLPPLPPAPETVAPPVDPTVATTTFAATQFLYSGSNPIQTGVAPGTIEARRAAVLRGQVLDKNNAPLPAVVITVLNHPEFGQTLSRADGMFDLAVNGGGYLTLNYQRSGYLPAQRQVNVPWQDFVVLDDAILIPKDAKVTTIDLSNTTTMQAAQGSVVTDQDGTRQPALLIPPGTTASRMMPDGSTQPLSTLSLRFTEYTVGANGPQTMPAPLPPTSGYTYAVEISADEAPTKLNGKDVIFNQPVPFYLDNFLNFRVGSEVPLGYYDNTRGVWVAQDNGRVIKVLSITNGRADLDLAGNGAPADAAALAALSITDAEREQLATLYAPGKSLWRVQLAHLSTHDPNWPQRCYGPGGCPPPEVNEPKQEDVPEDNPCNSQGSIIECENQTLGEQIPMVGSSFSLNYRSDRVSGRTAATRLNIRLSDFITPPPGLKRIKASAQVAGRTFDLGSFPPSSGIQNVTFTWDGYDVYGRPVSGLQPATIKIDYVYDGEYYDPVTGRGFGLPSAAASGSGIQSRVEIVQSRSFTQTLIGRNPVFSKQNMGGWSLTPHHVYDPVGKVLYQGDGMRRSTTGVASNTITTVAGNGQFGFSGDGGPATQARLSPAANVTATADGGFLIAQPDIERIRKVGPNGIITTIAGTGVGGYSGDGGPANQAQIDNPQGAAVSADGSILIADLFNNRIRRVGPDGIITTIAGTGVRGYGGDNGPANQAQINNPWGVYVAADGSVLIADTGNHRIRRMGPDGIITTIAGTGGSGYSGDGGPATQARITAPLSAIQADDGSILIADAGNHRIRRIGTDGIITTIAGGGTGSDGVPATQARLSRPYLALSTGDGILIADTGNHLIRRVAADGIITTIAGGGTTFGEAGLPTQASFNNPQGIAVAANKGILVADYGNFRIRQISPFLPNFDVGDIAIASEDGRQLCRFDQYGRHLSTVDTLTGATLYTFAYDNEGRLSRITDSDGNITTIERDGNGNPIAIVAPFGQPTTLTVDSNGYLASVTNPAGEAYQMQYTADGLLTRFTDPRNNASQFAYDGLGRLQNDANASGGSQNLARTELEDGYTVTRSTALGRATAYSVEDLSTGNRQRKVRTPDGLETQTLLGANGSTKTTAPDGTVTDALDGPDPRFGMQAPITTSSTVTTGGLTATTSSTATVEPANPTDPLNFTKLTRTATINGRTSRSVYDKATRKTTITSAAGRESYRVLDTQGRLIETGVTGLEPITMSYDGRGRLSSMNQGSGANARTTTFNYNSDGYLQSATDALGHSGSLDYDLAGRVIAQTLANGEQVGFTYDAKGNLTRLTPPGQPAHGFTHNAVDLATSYLPPTVAGGGDTDYQYNADKQLTRVTRPDGGVLSYAYDAAGRLSTLTIPAGQYGYSYNAAGKLSGITAPGGIGLSYSYNGSLLTGVTWSGGISGNVGFGYDNDFRVNQVSVNGANPISYQYDADSLLIQAGDLAFTRNADNGLLTGTTLGSVSDSYSYNGFGERTAYSASHNGAGLLDIAYTRDKLGRITQKVETVGGVTTTYDYGYDAIGQLIEVKQNGATTAIYVYDANGNRLSKTAGGSTVNGAYDAQDRLLSYGNATYTYTANGEMKTKTDGGQTTTYDYDALGNLRGVSLPDSRQIEYLIDGQNRRVGKKVNGALVQGFLYQSQLRPVAELDSSGNIVSRFVYGKGINVPDYMVREGVTYRIVTDHLGSPRLVVNTATGAIVQEMRYDEYGNVLTDTNRGFQPFGFAGGIYDRDTRLVRFGARDYDAESGRWTSKDPLLFNAGVLNLYAYAYNNPINYKDNNGLDSKPSKYAKDSFEALFAAGYVAILKWQHNKYFISQGYAPLTLSENLLFAFAAYIVLQGINEGAFDFPKIGKELQDLGGALQDLLQYHLDEADREWRDLEGALQDLLDEADREWRDLEGALQDLLGDKQNPCK